MTLPNPQVPVSEPVYSATKAINSTLVLGAAWVALVVKSMADGSITWAEGYEVVGAAIAGAGAVYATWKSRNKVKREV